MASYTFTYTFRSVRALPQDKCLKSPIYECFQSRWRVFILASNSDLRVCHFRHCARGPIRAKYLLKIDGSIHIGEDTWDNNFHTIFFRPQQNIVKCECTIWQLDEINNQPGGIEYLIRTKYLNGQLTDFNVIAGTSIIPVHKLVLATQSSEFYAMMCSSMQARATHELIITDFAPVVVKCFIDRIYGVVGTVNDIGFRDKLDVLRMANKFKIECVQSQLLDELQHTMTVENCLDALIFAQAWSLESFKQVTLKFIKANMRKIIETEKETLVGLGPLIIDVLDFITP